MRVRGLHLVSGWEVCSLSFAQSRHKCRIRVHLTWKVWQVCSGYLRQIYMTIIVFLEGGSGLFRAWSASECLFTVQLWFDWTSNPTISAPITSPSLCSIFTSSGFIWKLATPFTIKCLKKFLIIIITITIITPQKFKNSLTYKGELFFPSKSGEPQLRSGDLPRPWHSHCGHRAARGHRDVRRTFQVLGTATDRLPGPKESRGITWPKGNGVVSLAEKWQKMRENDEKWW